MIIHSVYFENNILPPGRSERHRYLLSVDVTEENPHEHVLGPRYIFETTNQGLVIKNKPKPEEKQKACFVPWSNIQQIIYLPETVQTPQGKK